MRYLLLPLATLAVCALALQATDDAKILKSAGLSDDGEKLVEYFRRRVVSEADRTAITQLIRKLGADQFAERERASEELFNWKFAAVNQLREALRDKDVEIAKRAEACLKRIEKVSGHELSAAAVRAIVVKKPDGAVEALLAFLP